MRRAGEKVPNKVWDSPELDYDFLQIKEAMAHVKGLSTLPRPEA
jgi:hypothetical protein